MESARGFAWVLNSLVIDFERYPSYGENLEIRTWYRGSVGFRSYRAFEVFVGNEKIASASIIWLFINIKDKKILKIPPEVESGYLSFDRKALESDIDSFKLDFRPDLRSDLRSGARFISRDYCSEY